MSNSGTALRTFLNVCFHHLQGICTVPGHLAMVNQVYEQIVCAIDLVVVFARVLTCGLNFTVARYTTDEAQPQAEPANVSFSHLGLLGQSRA